MTKPRHIDDLMREASGDCAANAAIRKTQSGLLLVESDEIPSVEPKVKTHHVYAYMENLVNAIKTIHKADGRVISVVGDPNRLGWVVTYTGPDNLEYEELC